jgi:transglutaminase-like putative cysteine protease
MRLILALIWGADTSHAGISVFAPVTGWVEFDPTKGLMPSDGHITLAWGMDYDDAARQGES